MRSQPPSLRARPPAPSPPLPPKMSVLRPFRATDLFRFNNMYRPFHSQSLTHRLTQLAQLSQQPRRLHRDRPSSWLPSCAPKISAELRLPSSVRSRAVLQLVLPLLPRQMARPVRVLHDALQPSDGLRFRPSSPLPALSSSHRLTSTFSSLDWVVLGKVEGDGTDHHGHVTALTVAPEYRRLKLASGLMNRLEASSSSPTHDGYFVRSLSLFLSSLTPSSLKLSTTTARFE